MKVLLMLALSMFFSSIASAGGSCKAHAKAIVEVVEFDIENCSITGKLKHSKGFVWGTFFVDLAKLKTGKNLRDEHMRDKYLEVKKYPKAKFQLDRVKIGSKKFTGKMTIRGITKKLSGDIVSSSPKKLDVKFTLDTTDYGIKKIGYYKIVLGQHLDFTATVY